jgi:hypothetical protein
MGGGGVWKTTLLDLIHEISHVIDDEEAIVATVVDLLASGQAHLTGNFRGVSLDELLGDFAH